MTGPMLSGLLILAALYLFIMTVLHGSWWNFVEAAGHRLLSVGLLLRAAADRGRRRSRRIEAEIAARWEAAE